MKILKKQNLETKINKLQTSKEKWSKISDCCNVIKKHNAKDDLLTKIGAFFVMLLGLSVDIFSIVMSMPAIYNGFYQCLFLTVPLVLGSTALLVVPNMYFLVSNIISKLAKKIANRKNKKLQELKNYEDILQTEAKTSEQEKAEHNFNNSVNNVILHSADKKVKKTNNALIINAISKKIATKTKADNSIIIPEEDIKELESTTKNCYKNF